MINVDVHNLSSFYVKHKTELIPKEVVLVCYCTKLSNFEIKPEIASTIRAAIITSTGHLRLAPKKDWN